MAANAISPFDFWVTLSRDDFELLKATIEQTSRELEQEKRRAADLTEKLAHSDAQHTEISSKLVETAKEAARAKEDREHALTMAQRANTAVLQADGAAIVAAERDAARKEIVRLAGQVAKLEADRLLHEGKMTALTNKANAAIGLANDEIKTLKGNVEAQRQQIRELEAQRMRWWSHDLKIEDLELAHRQRIFDLSLARSVPSDVVRELRADAERLHKKLKDRDELISDLEAQLRDRAP